MAINRKDKRCDIYISVLIEEELQTLALGST